MWELTQRYWEMAKIFMKWPRYMGHGLSILRKVQVCSK